MASPPRNMTAADLAALGVPYRTSWLQQLGIGIEIAAPALAFVAFSLRMYIRAISKNFGWDDTCICLAMGLSVAQCWASINAIKLNYVAIHEWDVPLHDPIPGRIWMYISGIVYNPILAIVRASILLFLLRIGGSTKDRLRRAIWALFGLNAALIISAFFSVLFVCTPIAFNWDKTIKDGKCFDRVPYILSMSGLTVLFDVMVMAIPIWIFTGLRMARKVKMALLVLFLLGGIVTVIGVVRIYFLYLLYFKAKTTPDFNFSIAYTTSAIETNLAIVAASGPALWTLTRRWFPGWFDSLGISRGYQGSLPFIESKSLGSNNSWLKNMRGDYARHYTAVHGKTPHASQEDFVAHNGIMLRRDISVTRQLESSRSDGRGDRWYGSRDPQLDRRAPTHN